MSINVISCILNTASTDTDIIQLPPASGSILKESDEDGKFTIPASTPHQEHDVKVTIQTESLVQNEKGNIGSHDNGTCAVFLSIHLGFDLFYCPIHSKEPSFKK